MTNKQKQCTKKQFNKSQVLGFLKRLKKGGYNKEPWRNEVSYYKCETCNKYHVSSKVGENSSTLIKGKTYLEHQKEKWKNFLINYSSKKARL